MAQRRGTGPKTSLLLAVLALCLTYAASSLDAARHFLLVGHVRCAEHGQWTHTERTQSEDSGAEVALRDALPALRGVAPPSAHEHEHCAQTSAQRSWCATAEGPALREISGAFQTALAPPRPTSPFGIRRVYAFAPKTSPPA